MTSITRNFFGDEDILFEDPVFSQVDLEPLDFKKKKLPTTLGQRESKGLPGFSLPNVKLPDGPEIKGPDVNIGTDLPDIDAGVDLTDIKVGGDIDLPEFEPLSISLPDVNFSPNLPELPKFDVLPDLSDVSLGVDLTDVKVGADLTDINLGVDLTGVSDTLGNVIDQAGDLTKPITDLVGDNFEKYKDDVFVKQGVGDGYAQIPIGETGAYLDYSGVADDLLAEQFKDTSLEGVKGSDVDLLVNNPEEFYRKEGAEKTTELLTELINSDNKLLNSFVEGSSVEGIANLIGEDLEDPETWKKAGEEALKGGITSVSKQVGGVAGAGISEGLTELVGKELNQENVDKAARKAAEGAGNEAFATAVQVAGDAILPGAGIVASTLIRIFKPISGQVSAKTFSFERKVEGGHINYLTPEEKTRFDKMLANGELVYNYKTNGYNPPAPNGLALV